MKIMNKIIDKLKFLGVLGSFRFAVDLLRTKTFYRKYSAKIIRFPFELNGKKNIFIGHGLSTGRYCKVEAYCINDRIALQIGNNCHLNDGVHIAALSDIKLGDDVLIAGKVFITDLNHGTYITGCSSKPSSKVANRALSSKPVNIGNNVWLGESVSILPGVNLGDNCIVGANSVVTKSFPCNSIIAGNPAKLVKNY